MQLQNVFQIPLYELATQKMFMGDLNVYKIKSSFPFKV